MAIDQKDIAISPKDMAIQRKEYFNWCVRNFIIKYPFFSDNHSTFAIVLLEKDLFTN
jgi:hypothetical protein